MILPVGPAGTIPEAVNKNAESLTPLTVEMYKMNMKLPQACGIALLALSGMMLAGCEANGDGPLGTVGGTGPEGNGTAPVDGGGDTNGSGGIDGGEFPNPIDASAPGVGNDVSTDGSDGNPNSDLRGFICRNSAQEQFGASTEVGADGLLGGPLSDLLNGIGGGAVTDLTNSVANKDYAIDGRLDSSANIKLVASLLGPVLDTVDLHVDLPGRVPAGGYAAFAVSLPPTTLALDLTGTITVETSLAGVATGETVTKNIVRLSLLGLGQTDYGFIGFKTTLPYDRATISVGSSLARVSTGPVRVHELCTARQ